MALEMRFNRFGVARLHTAVRRRLKVLVGAGLCVLGAASLIPWRPGLVSGASMSPTLPPGALFVLDTRYYRTHPVGAGDIVVFLRDGKPLVKRVYASEGAAFWTFRERGDGKVRRDPIRASQKSRFEQVTACMRTFGVRDARIVPMRVPPGHLFVVGDGATSEDSRQFGLVRADQVLGRVVEFTDPRAAWTPASVELSFPVCTTVARPVSRVRRGVPLGT